jgi:hypothetical protein
MMAFKGFFIAVVFLSGAGICASAEIVDVEKSVPVKTAPIVNSGKSDGGKALPMFRDAKKKPAIVTKAKVASVSSKSVSIRKTGRADKLNPSHVGANRISMRKINSYASRKSNSGLPGAPVKKAGGDPAENGAATASSAAANP